MGEKNSDRGDSGYIDARRKYLERDASLIRSAYIWRVMGLSAIALSGILTFGLVRVATQTRVVPYVVEVDKLGAAVAVGPAEKGAFGDEHLTKFQVANFISNARRVTNDRTVQTRWLDAAYALAAPEVKGYLDKFYKDHNPYTTAQSALVDVEVRSALPLSNETWQVEWTETKHDVNGALVDETRWQAVLKIGTATPTTEAEILRNPSGVVIKTLSWTQQL